MFSERFWQRAIRSRPIWQKGMPLSFPRCSPFFQKLSKAQNGRNYCSRRHRADHRAHLRIRGSEQLNSTAADAFSWVRHSGGQGRAVHLAGALFSQRPLRSLSTPPLDFLKPSLSSKIRRGIWSILNRAQTGSLCRSDRTHVITGPWIFTRLETRPKNSQALGWHLWKRCTMWEERTRLATHATCLKL